MVKPERTKIALIQMRCGPEPEKNFIRAVEFIRDAAKKGGQIVCLPELFRSQYFCQAEDHKYFELTEEVPGSGPLNSIARCGNNFLPNGNRMAPERKERIRCVAIFSLGNNSARSRDCEWLLCRCCEPGRS